MNKDIERFFIDLEGTGAFQFHQAHSGRPAVTRMTELAMGRVTDGTFTPIVEGYSDLVRLLVSKYKIMSVDKIPEGFWRELSATGQWDPSVKLEGTVVSSNLRRLIQIQIDKKTLKPSTVIIDDVMRELDLALARGKSVELVAYNRRYDLRLIEQELYDHPELLDKWRKLMGRIRLVSGEAPVQQAMFDYMLAHPDAMPRFSSSKAFDAALAAGKKKVGLEATTGHETLRRLVSDIGKMAKGGTASQVYKDAPQQLVTALAEVKDWGSYQAFLQKVERDPLLGKMLERHYKSLIPEASRAAPWVKAPSLEFIMGWRQEDVAKILRKLGVEIPAVTHKGIDDIKVTRAIVEALENNPLLRHKLASNIFESFPQQAQKRYVKFAAERGVNLLADAGAPITAGAATKGVTAAVSEKVLSKPIVVARASSRLFAPIAVVAGLTALSIATATKSPDPLGPIRSGISESIDLLRTGPLGLPPEPAPQVQSNLIADTAVIQYNSWDARKRRASKARNAARNPPSNLTFTPEEIATGSISLDDYSARAVDADTLKVYRKSTIDEIPFIGELFRDTQISSTKYLNKTFGLKLKGPASKTIRLKGIDAPEASRKFNDPLQIGGQPGSEAATERFKELLAQSTHIRISSEESGNTTQTQTTRRVMGAVFGKGLDVQRQMVREGHAVSTTNYYKADEYAARQRRQGIWQYPFFQGYNRAREAGITVGLSQLTRVETLAKEDKAQRAMAIAMWYRDRKQNRSGILDQYARSAYVFPQRPVVGSIHPNEQSRSLRF